MQSTNPKHITNVRNVSNPADFAHPRMVVSSPIIAEGRLFAVASAESAAKAAATSADAITGPTMIPAVGFGGEGDQLQVGAGADWGVIRSKKELNMD